MSQTNYAQQEGKTGKVVATRNTEIKKNESVGAKEKLSNPKMKERSSGKEKYNVSNVMSSNCCSPKCDYLMMFDTSVIILRATIFDRWGSVVIKIVEPKPLTIWKGVDVEGKPCKEGTYFYIIEIKDEIETKLKGNVTLFR